MRTSILSVLIPLMASAPAMANPQKTIKVTSSAFKMNEAIPAQYTCEGANKSPPLAWSNVPKNAKSVALVVEDPEAPKGTFTHWLVTDLPVSETSLAADAQIPQGAVAAKNDKGETGYTGPCPPSGVHHYHFHVYALDKEIGPQQSQSDFLSAIRGHVLAEGDLIATYEKSRKK
jgi:Raf kinase inhibitor-like YbhB/YbcL family protein